ncbi:MAG: hypothetical protein KBD21_03755 [Candidatus Pacebacteria bacterium]|nr:hypothetical protein [Candidatus Paceibacterota bacterium]
MLWGNAEADILREILRVDACSREVMLAKLHEVLVRTGHENVGLHLKGLYAPDGVPFPEAFAYVLGKDLVSGADRARIRFDHGQNTTSYLKEHFHIDLPWRALDMLLSQNDETPHTHTAEECLCC